QVNFRIYESEPYSKHSEVLNVFCSKELTVDYKDEKDVLSVYLKRQPDRVFDKEYYNFIITDEYLKENLVEQILKRFKEELNVSELKGTLPLGFPAANVILYSLPLAAIYLAFEVELQDKSPLGKVLSLFLEAIKFSQDCGKIEKERESIVKVYPALTFNWEAISVLFTSAALLDSILFLKKDGILSSDSLDDLYERGVTLKELYEILDDKGEKDYLGRIYNYVSRRELDVIKENCLKNKCGRFGELSPADWKGVEDKGPKRKKDKDPKKENLNWKKIICEEAGSEENVLDFRRNFIAHAGLNKEIIEGKLTTSEEGKTLFIRYRKNKENEENWWDCLKRKVLSKRDL
ncbi:hypothetical protein, partial [Thermovibrio sp.]